jgi:hypothetical protein
LPEHERTVFAVYNPVIDSDSDSSYIGLLVVVSYLISPKTPRKTDFPVLIEMGKIYEYDVSDESQSKSDVRQEVSMNDPGIIESD